jgi:hypothetical protein
MALDLSRRQASCVESEDLLVEAWQPSAPLGKHKLRLERSIPITRHFHVNF